MSIAIMKKSGPFAHGFTSVQKTMFLVLLALAPATVFNLYLFGWPAILLFIVTVGACVAVEAACLAVAGKPVVATLADCSAILTGWLLAMSLPPWAPWWIGVLAAIFAIALTKHAFGGLGQNLFNPAMVARVALLISFPLPMTLWVAPLPITAAAAPGFIDGLRITLGGLPAAFDAVTGATLLGHAKTELARGIDLLQAFAAADAPGASLSGARAGSLGETAAWLIAGGGVALMFLRIISWHIPLAMLAGIALPAAILHAVDPARYLDATTHLLSGGAMLGAFFIVTDPVSGSTTPKGKLIFAGGVALLTWIIRTFGAYPDGIAFAVLLMNIAAPLIDMNTQPPVFGHKLPDKERQ